MVGDTSAKLWRYFCDALVNISEALAMHPRGISGNGGGGRGGGVDLHKFSLRVMSVIFLYYFTCMFLSRVYSMGYYTINNFYYYHYHYYY